MMKKDVLLWALTSFLLVCSGLLRAEDKPMKLLVEPYVTTNGGGTPSYKLIVPVRSENRKYSLKWKKKEDAAWHEETQTKFFEKSVSEQGEYEIEIYPTNVVGLDYDSESNSRKTLLEIMAWGTIQWNGMSDAFAGCEKLKITASDIPDLSHVGSCNAMFSDCKELNSPNLSNWDLAKVESMNAMFRNCTKFNQPLNWDVSHVKYMSNMFDGATCFDQSLATWNLAKCEAIGLNGSGISDVNYQATLQGWVNNPQTNSKIKLDALGLFYGNATTARNFLINTKQWTITGDMEKLGTPKGNQEFKFVIKTSFLSSTKSIKLPIIGKNWSFSYTKEGGTPIQKTNVSIYPEIDVEPNTEYTVSVAPAGVAWCSFYRPNGFALTKIIQFGDVQWANLRGFCAYAGTDFTISIEDGAGVPDLSIVKDCSSLFSGMKQIHGLKLEGWDVSQVEDLENAFLDYKFDFDISSWKLHACKKLGIGGSRMSQANYDKALKAWAEDAKTNEGVILNADECFYTKEGEPYRNQLINEKRWVITGDHLPHFVEISKPQYSLFVIDSKLPLFIKDGGLTDEEKEATVLTAIPAGIAEVKKIHTGLWEVTFKEKGKALLRATVPAKEGVHEELNSEIGVYVIEMPALKFYANNELVMGNAVKLRANTIPSIMVNPDPLHPLLNSFNWQCVPYARTSINGNICTFDDPLNVGTYTLTATSAVIPTLTGTLTLEVADCAEVMIVGDKKATLYLNGEENEKSHQFQASVEPSDKVASQDVTFAVVTPFDGCIEVSKEGLVTAKKVGSARIKVTSDADSEAIPAYCDVTVTHKIEEIEIHAADPYVITDNKIKIHKGESVNLFVTFEPDGILNKEFNWQFDLASGITTEKLPNGDTKFTVNKTGAWEITAISIADPTKTDRVTLEVDNPLKGFVISENGKPCTNLEFQLKKGDEKDFTYTTVPTDADARTDIQWSSATPAKVSIDATTGHLKVEDAAQIGDKIKISVKTVSEPIVEASFTVSVVDEIIDPVGVSIVPQEDQTLFVGGTLEFKATVNPSKAPQTVLWVVTPDDGTLTIAPDGKAVAQKEGTVTVKAVTRNEKTSNEVKVTIKSKIVQPLTKIEFVNPATSLKVNEEVTFTIQFTPDKDIDKALEVTFAPEGYLSLKSVNDGKITVMGMKDSENQEITITAKSKSNSSLTPATCKVKVTKVTSVADAPWATIAISPNPFTSVLRVANPSALRAKYELFNVQGMLLREGVLENGETSIHTADLARELYLLRITTVDGEAKTYRVLKQ